MSVVLNRTRQSPTDAPLRKVANGQNAQIASSNELATHSGGVPSHRPYVAGIGSGALPLTLRRDVV